METCELCGKKFENKRSLGNHRRWHPELEKYREFQKVVREKNLGVNNPMYGKIPSEEHKQKIRNALLGDKCYKWKGDKVGYFGLHDWLRKNMPNIEYCQKCGKKKKLCASNISGEYKRDLSDYEWLCYQCHNKKDGITDNIINLSKPFRFEKGQIPWNKGIPRDENTKKKISQSLIKYFNNN